MRTPLLSALIPVLLALAAPAPARAETGRFVVISDIHFDPFQNRALFDRLRAQPAERWAEVLEASATAAINPRGTDSNYALLKSSLDDAARRVPDPDFVLYPGDFLAHGWQTKYDAWAETPHAKDPGPYRDFTAKTVRFLASEFRKRYPETPVLPTLGNDDSYCGDYMITPDGPFLSMFAGVWAPLLGPRGGEDSFRATFPKAGYYSVRLPGAGRRRLVVLNSVYFSVNYNNACGESHQTPALDQLRWFEQALQSARDGGESVWLLMHIPPGINSYNSAEDVGRGGPPETFWQPSLTARFLRLVRDHAAVLRVAFTGHTHMDDFRVVRLDGGPVLLCKIAPAVSPVFGNNPAYQVYQYDRASGALEDYQTYFLINLPDAQNPAPGGGRWALEYSFRDAYGAPALDAGTVNRLANDMATVAPLRQTYSRFYAVSAPPEFSPDAFDIYRCAIANISPAEFLTCLTGAAKPKRPTDPDRVPRTRPVPQR